MMGMPSHDIDICTHACPEEIIRIMKDAGYDYYDAGIQFGTVNVQAEGEMFEVTTYRTDGAYRDGRHPDEVQFVDDVDGDLARRDFTINAMAFDPTTNILRDPCKGLEDLRAGIIRAVGDANERFQEDALRIMRAIRFAVKFGFTIEDDTLQAMLDNKDLLCNISKERITQEMEKTLTCGKPVRHVFDQCRDILGVIFPELIPCFDFDQNSYYHSEDVYRHMLCVVDACKSDKFEIKLAALLHDVGKPDTYFVGEGGYGHFHGHPEVSYQICSKSLKENLRLSTEQYKLVTDLIRYHDNKIPVTKKEVLRFLNKHGESFMEDFMYLKHADIDAHIHLEEPKAKLVRLEELRQEIAEENSAFQLKDLAINGKDVCRLTDTKPDKHIGTILNRLLDDVIDEAVLNNKQSLSRRTKEIWKEIKDEYPNVKTEISAER